MTKYKVVVLGVAGANDRADVIQKVALAFKISTEAATSILSTPQGFVVKSGLALEAAVKYEQALGSCGCNVTVVPENATGLELDVGNATGISSDVQPATQLPAAPALKQASDGVSATSLVSGLVSLAFFAYFVYWAFPYFAPGELKAVVARYKGDNPLEKTLKIGQSTSEDFRRFKTSGGLDVESGWHGFKVRSVEQIYEGNVLSLYKVNLEKNWPGYTLASLDNLKTSLRGDCGSSWTMNDDSSGMEAQGPAGIQCVANTAGGDGVDVTFARVQKTATNPSPPSPAGRAQPIAGSTAPAIPNGSIAVINPQAQYVDPAGFAALVVGKHPSEAFSSSEIGTKFKALLGGDFEAFSQSLSVGSAVKNDPGDGILGMAFAPHTGGDMAAAYAMDPKGRLFAVLVNREAAPKVKLYGASDIGELPPGLARYVRDEM